MVETNDTVEIEELQEQLAKQKKRTDRLKRKAREIEKLQVEWELEKQKAAQAKKKFERAQIELRKMNLSNDSQPELPFAEADDEAVQVEGQTDGEPIELLGMTAAENEKLAESKFEIKTVGDLESLMASNAFWHRDIKGFGPAKVDKLTDALMRYRTENPL